MNSSHPPTKEAQKKVLFPLTREPGPPKYLKGGHPRGVLKSVSPSAACTCGWLWGLEDTTLSSIFCLVFAPLVKWGQNSKALFSLRTCAWGACEVGEASVGSWSCGCQTLLRTLESFRKLVKVLPGPHPTLTARPRHRYCVKQPR